MRRVCSVAAVRRAEAGAGVAEPVLMQRAATALAGVCAQLIRASRGRLAGARLVGLIGSGNNGGDALWALSFLAGRGVAATAVGDPARMHAPGAAAARAAGVRLVDWADPLVGDLLARADLALDGIVGIGGSGSLRNPAAAAVAALSGAGVPIVAVDVPSGVDTDTGEVPGAAVRAATTVCFGVLKPGLLLTPGREHAGMVTVIDIGLPGEHLVPTAWALSLADLPEPDPQPGAHKYRRGVVGVTAGSGPYPGAAVLAVAGARRSGVGMVALRPGTGGQGADDPVGAMVVSRFPDVVLAGEREVQARCIGPGLAGDRGADLVLDALSEPVPVVVDASGLQVLASAGGRHALAERAGRGWPTVLTPHAGEFARLGFDLSGGPLEAAGRAATALGAVIVLKGPGTVVAEPGGTAYIDTFGTVALATAGSGDVLAGLMAGMLARPRDVPTNAQVALTAARAVGLHGLAGRLAAGGGAVTALDVAEALDTAVETARAGALPG